MVRPGPAGAGELVDGRVTAFLRANRGLDFCDECLARELRVAVRQARAVTGVLRRPEFERRQGLCAGCLRNRRVVGSPIT